MDSVETNYRHWRLASLRLSGPTCIITHDDTRQQWKQRVILICHCDWGSIRGYHIDYQRELLYTDDLRLSVLSME